MHAADADTLNSIRLALEREEQQIRVNDATSREIYDLTLSRSAPYASPIISRTTTPNNAASSSSPSTSSTGHKILRLPQLVSRRHHQPLVTPEPNTLAPSAPASAPAPASSSQNALKPANFTPAVVNHHPFVGELPPSPPLEADYISGINGKPGSSSIPSSAAPQQEEQHRLGSVLRNVANELSAATSRFPTPKRAYTTELGAMTISKVNGVTANGNANANVIYAEPSDLNSLGKDASFDSKRLARGPNLNGTGSRGVSDGSTISTSYRTASSNAGSDTDDTGSPTTPIARPAPVAPSITLTHDPTQYIHSDPSTMDAGPSSRRASHASVATATPPARQPPSRRNTTGSALQTRRPPSASSLSQRSRRSSRDRDNTFGGPAVWAPDMNTLSPTHDGGSSLALRTGDAAFDEEAALHAEQLRRERRVKEQKKAAAAAAAASDHDGLRNEKDVGGGGALSALTRSKTNKEARHRDDDQPQVLVGNLIGEGHANYVLMYNMLTGIRIGVSRCQAKMKRQLTEADYSAKHKFTFDIIGNELTPSAKYDFKFKDYAPWVFRELREYFHLDPADYLLSLTSKYILSELGSPGKSGSFFYFSRDYRFIIKTIRHQEHKFLLRILKDYHEHIKSNPHTLLSRFYGLHRVKLPHGRKIHFVIMNNLFPPHRDIHETYDLKGSSVGREYPEEKAAAKKGAVLKDLNWLRRQREIELGPEKRALFEAQLRSDVALLQRLNIMDYSLLIGLHDMRRGNKENLRQDALHVFQPDQNRRSDAPALREAVRRSDPKALGAQQVTKLPDHDASERRHFLFYQDEGGFRSTDSDNQPGHMIYYLGVIDLFTPYTSVKRAEHFWKGFSQNKHMISAVPPREYGERFINFLCSVVTGGDKSKRPKMHGFT